MCRHLLVAVCLLMGSILCGCFRGRDSYKIAMRWLPTQLNPWTESENGTHVFYTSLYFPLIEHQGGVARSEFLDLEKSGAISHRFDRYRLCLKSSVQFSDGTEIQAKDLVRSIQHSHKNIWLMPNLVSARTENRCVIIQLGRGDPNYLTKIGTRQSTILKADSLRSTVPIGLGPYSVSKFEKDHIILVENSGRVSGALKRIDFFAFELASANRDLLQSIDDWNFYDWPVVPPELTGGFQEFRKEIPIIRVLYLSYPDERLRKEFYRCVDRRGLIEAEKLDVRPQYSLFPESVFAVSKVVVPDRSACEFSGVRPKVKYYTIGPFQQAVEKFFRKAGRTLPFEVDVQLRSSGEIWKLWKNAEPCVFIGAFDAYDDTPESFLGRFVSKTWPKAFAVSGVKELLTSAAYEALSDERRLLIQQAHDKVLESAVVVPLGQARMTYLFRPDLESIEVPNAGNGVPILNKIKVKPRLMRVLTSVVP